MWWGGWCALEILGAISAGALAPGSFYLAGQVPGERPDELQHTGTPGWGLGNGPITHPRKNVFITETGHSIQDSYRLEEGTGLVPPDKDICFMDYQRNITLAGESYTEACQSKTSLLKPKKTLVFGNWNILTMYAVRKSAQVAKEMREYNIDILGISDGPGLER